jgi:hypothetical protein
METVVIGPVVPEVRDRIADYRDSQNLPNYNTALMSLLKAAEQDEEASQSR